MHDGSEYSRGRPAARRAGAAAAGPRVLLLGAALAAAIAACPARAAEPAAAPAAGQTVGPAAGLAVAAAARPVTEADCADLLRQFDVAWPSHRDAAKAAAAREARDRGAGECRERRYAEGVHHLRRALRGIGVKPAKLIRKPEK